MQQSLTLSVTELTFAIKSVLEPSFRNVAVKGEISNLKLQSSGHFYFSLKDAGAQLSAVLFKGSVRNLSRLPKEGDQVIALGEISLYAPRGSYQLVIRELQFAGLGELLLKLQEKKKELEARGWFDPKHKKPLPKLPKKIGVVTSPTGAVIQDILQVLTRRFQGFQILLNPVKVQGEGAAEEIAQAIYDFNRYQLADVLIVGRGGGSIEDLWAFNEEIVAKAIFDSKIPIISAIGHETDTTIADWVADVRAPTPSAAAEMVILEKVTLLKFLSQTQNFLQQKIQEKLQGSKQKLSSLQKHPLFSSPRFLLSGPMQRIDDLQTDITLCLKTQLHQKKLHLNALAKQASFLQPSHRIGEWKGKLAAYQDKIQRGLALSIRQKKERLERIGQHLKSINPNNLLKKGYAILFSENRDSIIVSTRELSEKQSVCVLLHDGKVSATVDRVDHDTTPPLL